MFGIIKMKKNKGFTLTEILLVLVIAAAIVISAFIIYPKVQSTQKVDVEAKNISTIIAGVHSMYGGKADFSGLDTKVAVQARVFPDNMILNNDFSGNTLPVNSWKGDVSVAVSTGVDWNDNGGFRIKYLKVPNADCVKLVAAVSGDFYQVGIGTGEVYNVKNGTDGTEMSIKNITDLCSAGPDEYKQINFTGV